MNPLKLILIFVLLLLISGCSSDTLTEEIEFRVTVLYSHTLQMRDISDSAILDKISLDISVLVDNNNNLTTDDKIEILSLAYGIEVSGTYEEKLILLEDKMVLMMEEYY